MAQIRVERKNRFTLLPNQLLQDPNISLKAKGLMAYMLSVPEDWDYSISGLAAKCREGKTAVRAAITELMEAGYITRTLARTEDGRLDGYEYTVYEEPQPSSGNPTTGFPTPENRTEQNNNITKTNLTNTPYSPPEGEAAEETAPEEAPESPSEPKPRRRRRGKSVPEFAPERFEQFWQAYPGGGSRMDAVAAWDELRPDDALINTMARALKRQMATKQWREGIGIPHAARWLRKQRWTDKLPAEPAPAPAEDAPYWAQDPEVI